MHHAHTHAGRLCIMLAVHVGLCIMLAVHAQDGTTDRGRAWYWERGWTGWAGPVSPWAPHTLQPATRLHLHSQTAARNPLQDV